MSRNSRSSWKHLLQNKKAMITIICALGFIVNVFWYFQQFLPEYTAWKEVQNERDALQARLSALQKSASQPEIEREQFESLLRQVPLEPEYSELLRFWKSVAADRGIDLLNVTFSNRADPVSETELESMIRSGILPSLSDGAAAPTANTSAANGSVQTKTLLEEISAVLTLKGEFLQLADFADTLHKANRLTVLKDWSLGSGGGESLTLQLSVNVYSARNYALLASHFADESPQPNLSALALAPSKLNKEQNETNRAPTVSQQSFFERLKNQSIVQSSEQH